SVINYASALILRFEQTTDDSDLDLAIKQLEEWLKAQSPNDPTSRRLVLMTLAQAQEAKWKIFGDVTDLESMIESERQILELCPPNDAEDERCLDRLGAALAQRPKKVSSDTTVLPKVSINDKEVELVEERRLPEGSQTVKNSEMVEKSVMINPAEISTPQAALPTVTSNNSAPVCVIRPMETPSSSAWKENGQQLSTNSDVTPTASSTPPFVTPPTPSNDNSENASLALAKSLMESDMESDAKNQLSSKVLPLLTMGFAVNQIMTALVAAGLNYELTLEYLLEGIPAELQEDSSAVIARVKEKCRAEGMPVDHLLNPFAGSPASWRSHTGHGPH
ncbi:hypothetical protein FRB98_006103, partial [Tulasnella sp. 332]